MTDCMFYPLLADDAFFIMEMVERIAPWAERPRCYCRGRRSFCRTCTLRPRFG